MPNFSAINNDEASPYDSLEWAKAILRDSTERALLEKRRIEKQRGQQSSMLEYTEHARRVRKAHLELEARGGTRAARPTVADRLGAALSYKPRKGRSPLRASDGDLRRLYGCLTNADKKALADRYLPEILQSEKGSNGSTVLKGNRREQQRGEGADFWDIVTKDGTMKRVVILPTDDKIVHLRRRKPQRETDSDTPIKASERNQGGLLSYRSDGSKAKGTRTESTINPQPPPSVSATDEDSTGIRNHTYHFGILPRPQPTGEISTIPKPTVKIEISLSRMQLNTPSPEPSDPGEETQEEKVVPRQKIICLKHGVHIEACKRCVHYSGSLSTASGISNTVSQAVNQLRVSTLTYPMAQSVLATVADETQNVVSKKPSASETWGPEVSQSSLPLGDHLAYHRAFTVNTSVQSLPARMEGILKNAMSSAHHDPSNGAAVVSTDSHRETEPATSAANRSGMTCRHGQVASACNTCRTVQEIQRRVKTNDFRREVRQTFKWDLEAETALSKSSRWSGGGKSNLVPHLKEMWARKKQTSTVRQKKPSGMKQGLIRNAHSLYASMERSCANSILKASTESLGRKKSVRFADDDVYHPMTGYHPAPRDTDNVASAS